MEHADGLSLELFACCVFFIRMNHGSMEMSRRISQLETNKYFKNDSLKFLLLFECSSESFTCVGDSIAKSEKMHAQV